MYPHVTQFETRLRRLNEAIELLDARREPREPRRATLARGRDGEISECAAPRCRAACCTAPATSPFGLGS
jgi:hypothetical protein